MTDIGLVLVQSAPRVAHDPLISGIGHGLEEILIRSDRRVVTRVVRDSAAEADVYRAWSEHGAVDGVVLVRLRSDDLRPALLADLGLPFSAIVDEDPIGGFPAVVLDTRSTMRAAIEHLVSRGHVDIAFAFGLEGSATRSIQFLEETRGQGLRGRLVPGDPTPEGGARSVSDTLALDPVPTAIVFDDDVTAVAGLEELRARGVAVPDSMAVVSLTDSVLCQSSAPPITAPSSEAHAVGLLAGRSLIEFLDTGDVLQLRAPSTFIVERATT